VAVNVTNNNGGAPITTNGTYCFIEVPGYEPPNPSFSGVGQAQFGTVSYAIVAGSTGGGTIVSFLQQCADGVTRALSFPAPITLTNGQNATGTLPAPLGGVSLLVSSLTGNGIASASLTGALGPSYVPSTATGGGSSGTVSGGPPPHGTGTGSPPAQAAAAGFNTLIFNDEFDVAPDIGFGSSGHKWNSGQWYQSVYGANRYSQSGSVLTITADASTIVYLCTQGHGFMSGTYFLYGYFEARMSCTDWSSFWLYKANQPVTAGVNSGDPLTWISEIDIIETDQTTATKTNAFFHKNTGGGGGVPDGPSPPQWPASYNGVFNYPAGGQITDWHIYGVLWTASQVAFYCDNILLVNLVPPYASAIQPMTLLLGAAPGGVNGGGSVVPIPTTQIDWVRVWQSAPRTDWQARQYVTGTTVVGSTSTCQMDVPTQSGSTLVVAIFKRLSVSGVAINAGSATFSLAVSAGVGTLAELWVASNITGSGTVTPTVTVTYSGAPSGAEVVVFEVFGGAGTVDVTGSATGTGTSLSASATTTVAGDLVIAAHWFGGAGFTYNFQGGPWYQQITGGGDGVGAYAVQASAGAISSTATCSPSATGWSSVLVALKH
jgi:hypothetical protein